MISLCLRIIRLKNAFLVVASLLFYSYSEPINVLLMIAVIIFTYAFALYCKGKRWIVALGVAGNIILLAIFKYTDLIITSLNYIFSLQIPQSNIALPIGISFFIFQAISYLIDVYRGDVERSKPLLNVVLYISFFPQLIAGPIVRYSDVEKQIKSRSATTSDMCKGIRHFCVGLAKKVLIADVLASSVDAIYAQSPEHIGFYSSWIAAVFYCLQIYFDFSGYSDMAIGMAQMFGFKYRENFNYPYISTSVKEFWRRWHISLSTWFREYLYIPLGGNRCSKVRCVSNKIIVFLLCGIWHGSFTFVIWGLLHGCALLLEDFLPLHKINKHIRRLRVLIFIAITFVIFRSESLTHAFFMISNMFFPAFATYDFNLAIEQVEPLTIFTLALAIIGATPIRDRFNKLKESAKSLGVALECSTYVASFSLLTLSMLTLSGSTYSPFIYFRF